jgi:hypothetical protein
VLLSLVFRFPQDLLGVRTEALRFVVKWFCMIVLENDRLVGCNWGLLVMVWQVECAAQVDIASLDFQPP